MEVDIKRLLLLSGYVSGLKTVQKTHVDRYFCFWISHLSAAEVCALTSKTAGAPSCCC